MPFKPAFWYEVSVLPSDPDSGALLYRITGAAAISHNIYCEQPYASPDGRRVAIIRSPWGHAHAYPTADNRHVIFNSEFQGAGEVYAACVPAGFLESLL